MGLFSSTAKRLASGPTLLFPADPGEAMAEAVLSYDPALWVKSDRFVLGNGVLLYGPVEVTAGLAGQAGLPPGLTVAYYTGIAVQGKANRRPDEAKRQDAECLIRGLAARLGGTVHDQRPPMELTLRASVFSGQPVPAEQVISVLQPFTDGPLILDEDAEVAGAYFLVTEEEPVFFTMYWPPRLSRSKLQPPPPAIGELRDAEPGRWDLRTKFPAEAVDPQVARRVGEAALALAARTSGAVTDVYGFPVTRPGDLVPR